jgi:hypothetical protein
MAVMASWVAASSVSSVGVVAGPCGTPTNCEAMRSAGPRPLGAGPPATAFRSTRAAPVSEPKADGGASAGRMTTEPGATGAPAVQWRNGPAILAPDTEFTENASPRVNVRSPAVSTGGAAAL